MSNCEKGKRGPVSEEEISGITFDEQDFLRRSRGLQDDIVEWLREGRITFEEAHTIQFLREDKRRLRRKQWVGR